MLRFSDTGSDIDTKVPSATGHAALEHDVATVGIVNSLNVFLHFGHTVTPPPVDIQNADQQSMDLLGIGGMAGRKQPGPWR